MVKNICVYSGLHFSLLSLREDNFRLLVNKVTLDSKVYLFFSERGVVWEETIILLPDNVHYVFLSATIPNARQFAEWICHLHKQVFFFCLFWCLQYLNCYNLALLCLCLMLPRIKRTLYSETTSQIKQVCLNEVNS